MGQTSRSAGVLQDPLFMERIQPYSNKKMPTWTSAAGLEESCPTRSASARLNGHCTTMVAVFEVTLPMEIVTGTALPAATPAGTKALTWYRPT